MADRIWQVVVLAAGRGPNDPMARAYGIAHKCALSVAGKPMLARVVDAITRSAIMNAPIHIVIDDEQAGKRALGDSGAACRFLPPEGSAPASAAAAIRAIGSFPVLITTGDHPLLTPDMIIHMTTEAEQSGADVLAAMATADVIQRDFPETKRTYFNLGGTRVSGCNLFAVMNANGLKLVHAWETAEKNRKKPLHLVAQFGVMPLVIFALGLLTPSRAFDLISRRLGIVAKPVFMPFAEAAIDVDKPEDLVLAEAILKKREAA